MIEIVELKMLTTGEKNVTLCFLQQRLEDGKYAHKVRIALGNGLRPDIWAEFKNRFNVEHIREFYAATEGNFFTMNMDDKLGTVGRYPQLAHVSTKSMSRSQRKPQKNK